MLTCKYSKQNSDTGRGKGSEEQVETHCLVKWQDSVILSSASSREETAGKPKISTYSLFQPCTFAEINQFHLTNQDYTWYNV